MERKLKLEKAEKEKREKQLKAEQEKLARIERLEKEKKDKAEKLEKEKADRLAEKERKAKEEAERKERIEAEKQKNKPSIAKFFVKHNKEESNQLKSESNEERHFELVKEANSKFSQYQTATEAIRKQKECIIKFGDVQRNRSNFSIGHDQLNQ